MGKYKGFRALGDRRQRAPNCVVKGKVDEAIVGGGGHHVHSKQQVTSPTSTLHVQYGGQTQHSLFVLSTEDRDEDIVDRRFTYTPKFLRIPWKSIAIALFLLFLGISLVFFLVSLDGRSLAGSILDGANKKYGVLSHIQTYTSYAMLQSRRNASMEMLQGYCNSIYHESIFSSRMNFILHGLILL
nr:uncharacterized protein LOC127316981 isoform X3 [Lolium perenne]